MILKQKHPQLRFSLLILLSVISCVNRKESIKIDRNLNCIETLYNFERDTITYNVKNKMLYLKLFNKNKLYFDSIKYIFSDEKPRMLVFNNNLKAIKVNNNFIFGLPYYGHHKVNVFNVLLEGNSFDYRNYDCMNFSVVDNNLITTEKELLCDTCTVIKLKKHIYKL